MYASRNREYAEEVLICPEISTGTRQINFKCKLSDNASFLSAFPIDGHIWGDLIKELRWVVAKQSKVPLVNVGQLLEDLGT